MFRGQASEQVNYQCPFKRVISAETYDVKLPSSLHHHLMIYSIQLDFSLCLGSKELKGY